ncbi:MAG: glycosyl hydrolase family 18 protein [Clostridia bacterium]
MYNYAALGQAADYVDLMLYDAHDNGGPAGPVAPMNWVTSIVKYAESTIAPGKILIGLAGYGYNWAADGSTEISDAQALALQSRYGSTFVGNGIDEARITYTDANGYAHTVWFEDSTSEAYKVAFVSSGHLGGVALWDLGEEDAGVWPMLASHL